MLQRLNVALVYNVKKEIVEEVSSDDGSPDKYTGEEKSIAVKTELHRTKADTYAEWDTEETILAVKAALELHHDVTLIEANEESYQTLLQAKPDIVFNIAEGLRGPSREAQIPAILEMLGIPYTGSDSLTLGICLDKSRTKEILSYHKILTPSFCVVNDLHQLSKLNISLPCIVKPLHEGSSKGIYNASIVHTEEELHRQIKRVIEEYEEPALVEKFLTGREFTVAVLGNGSDLRVLPVVEIRFDSLPDGVNPIYSFEAKWIWDTLENPIDVHECPAKVSLRLQKEIEAVCRDTYRVLRCRDWCRIDIRLDEQGRPNVLELNPLPGILPNPEEHSCFPQAARAAGMDYNTMINAVLSEGIKRYNLS
ncbi:MAG: ATP-grasp domain-containing protein [Bacteroidota bacterium]